MLSAGYSIRSARESKGGARGQLRDKLLIIPMNRYVILNSRKRTIIALIHTVAFGLLAFWQFATNQHPAALVLARSPHLAGPLAMTAVYLIVTVVLLILLRYSGTSLERLYFGLVSTSAGIGLLRVAFGDPTLHLGALIRVLLLGCAALVGLLILKQHSGQMQFAD